MNDPRYPIGPFDIAAEVSADQLRQAVDDLRGLPAELEAAVSGLSDEQLDTPYRAGGWTLRQLVHHIADSHINAFVRVRLALTEDAPEIRPYLQDAWVRLEDALHGPIEPSLEILRGLHQRWCTLLDSLGEEAFERPLRHPKIGELALRRLLALYGWHSRHHVAHITVLRQRKGW